MHRINSLRSFLAILLLTCAAPLFAEVTRIEVNERSTLSDGSTDLTYESITGVIYFTLDPTDPANATITDIGYAPVNSAGLVEFSADFKMLVPPASIANGGLLYNVNNRGGKVSEAPPGI